MKLFRNHNVKRQKVVEALASVRREWEGEGEKLTLVDGSVGVILYDLATALGLSSAECIDGLGSELVSEVEAFLNGRVEPQAAAHEWVKEF